MEYSSKGKSQVEGGPKSDTTNSEIVVIGGFLGSGKTTLLKRLLEWEFGRGIRPLVIMSEFGDFDVDGALITDERLELTAITGGCVCCGNRDELARSLDEMLTRTPGAHIYIEATGVADPAGVLQAITPIVKSNRTIIKKVIVVYDASSHNDLGRDANFVEKQLMTCDWIIVNKCDLVPDRVKAITTDLCQINPSAKIATVVSGAVDPEEVTGGVTRCFAAGTNPEVIEGEYSSFAFKFDTRLSRKELENWLASLPPAVIRVKGFVRFADQSGIFEVQATRGRYSITPFDTRRWLDSTLVAITHPMSADELVKGLEQCLPPSEIDKLRGSSS
jgi:G3E family GTPase